MLTVIAVDCGRSGVKAVSETERIYFRSALGAWRELRNQRELGHDEYDVEYNGERFFVGRIAADEADDGGQMFLAMKAHKDTKILTLTAIHRLVEDGARVFLMTGLPVAFHTDFDKMKMRGLLLGEHVVTSNGSTKKFTIERVEVGAEGSSVGWAIGRVRRDRFHVVDVGSRTVNYATVRGGKWVDRDSDSLDYGFETFKGSESQFARVLVSDLSRVLRPLGPVVLVGGKESLVQHLREYHNDIEIHPDSLFANAVAFREMGCLLNGTAAKTS